MKKCITLFFVSIKQLSITKLAIAKRVLSSALVLIALFSITSVNALEESTSDAAHQEEEHGDREGKEEDHEEKAAALNATQLKTAAINLAQVAPATIHETLPLYGMVEPNAEQVQKISARFPGVVRSVNKKVGDVVRQNDVLATVESNESLKTYSITSALNGVVAERNLNPGEQTSDKTAFVIADLSTVWVDISVFPRDAAKIGVGQSVRIGNPANGGTTEGKIIAIAALGNSTNQSLSARVLLNNPQRQWTPGLFVNAEVILAKTPVALAVRNEALQTHEGKQVVFVKDKDGFEPRPVTLGRTDGEMSEVLSGVNSGETYAANNSFIIKAELGKDGAEHGH
jgi:cobalt-zinc-cadmium efflux system membrane fusion protein